MDRDDKIIFYLKGRLTAEEKSKFKEEMENDPELAEEVEFQSTMVAVAHHLQEKKLRALMQAHPHKFSEDPKRKKVVSLRRWSIAASIALILGIVAFFYISQFSNSSLYAQAKGEYPPLVDETLRDTNPNAEEFNSDMIVGLHNNERKRADEFIDYFSSLEPGSSLYPRAQFNLGFSYLLKGDHASAVKAFEGILNSDHANESLKNDSQYYLALAYLKDGQHEETTKLLNAISENPLSIYQDRAEQLLEKMDSPFRLFWGK